MILPPEILLKIVKYVDVITFGKFIRCNREIYELINPADSKWFNKYSEDVTEESLYKFMCPTIEHYGIMHVNDDGDEIKAKVCMEYKRCNGRKFGECVIYNEDMIEISRHNYVDGKINGPYIASGIILGNRFSEKVMYINGMRQGLYRTEYSEYSAEAFYKDDKLHGPYVIYKNDERLLEYNYYEGNKHGLCKISNDICKMEVVYNHGKRQGRVINTITYHGATQVSSDKSYDENGLKHGIYTKCSEEYLPYVSEEMFRRCYKEYNHGVKHGLCIKYYTEADDPDQIYTKSYYVNGKKHGVCRKYYNEAGTMYRITHYKNGILNGLDTHYNNGHITDEINYINGYREGLCVECHYQDDCVGEFDIAPAIFIKATYKNNKLHGRYRMWNRFGELVKECYYNNGVLHGLYRKYDELGRCIKERHYDNGNLYLSFKYQYIIED